MKRLIEFLTDPETPHWLLVFLLFAMLTVGTAAALINAVMLVFG